MPGWQPRQPTSQWSGSSSPRARLLAASGPSTDRKPPHILASPPGTTAPLGAINYTPKTNQIHPPGMLAPVDQLNYSLLPHDSLSSGGMGMGAEGSMLGGAPPVSPGQERLVGRYKPPSTMASGQYTPGAPPTTASPYGTGPGPRSSPSGPGQAGFGTRGSMLGNTRGWGMGMGADAPDLTPEQAAALDKYESGQPLTAEEQQALDSIEGGLPNVQGGQAQQQASGGQTQGQSQQGGQTQQATGAPTDDSAAITMAQSGADLRTGGAPSGWHTEGKAGDPQNKPSELWLINDADTSKRLYVGTYQYYGIPPTAHFVHATTSDQQKLSSGIDFTKAKTQPNLQTKEIYNPDTKQTEIWNWDPATGQKVGDKPIGIAKPTGTTTPKTTAKKVQPVPGLGVLVEQPDGSMALDPGLSGPYNQAQASKTSSAAGVETQRAQTTLDTDKPYNTFVAKDGATWLVNDETGDAYPITPADPLNGIFTVGNQLVQVDPDTQKASVVYNAPHNWSVTTSGGRTIAYDPQDPTKHQDIAEDPTYAPQAQATLDETRANIAKLQQGLVTGDISNEDARAKLAMTAHDLTHPAPIGYSGGWLIPPGASMDIQQDIGGSMAHFGGQPLDPETQKISDQINDFLGKLGGGSPTQTTPPSTASTQPTTTAQAGQAAGAVTTSADTGQTTTKPLLAPGEAGTAKGDPSLSDTGVPELLTPTQVYKNVGIDLAAMPGAGPKGQQSRQLPTTTTNPQLGSTLEVGLKPRSGDLGVRSHRTQEGDSGWGMGGGQDSFMGRGLTPQTGRGSTGIGWQPQAQGWGPGAGHVGGSGMSGGGGAGQDEVIRPRGGGLTQDGGVIPPILPPALAAAQSQQPPQPLPQQGLLAQQGPQQPGGQAADALGMGQAQAAPHLNDPLYHFAMQQRQTQGAGQDEGMPPPAPGASPPPGPPGAAAPQPGSPPPGAPSPGWTPPLPPQAVAGIGHRFGQAMNQGEPQHSGVDLQAPEGTPTVSPVDGMVERVEHNPEGLGLTVIIRGKDGTEHRLGHLSHTDVYPGMIVGQGQDLQSKVGSSGNTTGAHLHWGVRDGQGQPQDPTAALGPMANMPPVPGTQQMGPPGGTPGPGGGPPGGPPPTPPQPGGGPPPPMGGGQDSNSPEYQAGYQAGLQASKSPGMPPVFVPAMAQPIPSAGDGGDGGGGGGGGQPPQGAGQEDAPHNLPRYDLNPLDWGAPYSQMSTGFSGGQEGGMGSPDSPAVGGVMGDLRMHPRMRPWNITPGATGTGNEGRAWMPRPGAGQDSVDSRWDLYEAKDTQGFWGPQGQPQIGAGGEGGMGAGAPYTDVTSAAQNATIKANTAAQNQANAIAQQQLQANIQAENDRHAETMAQLQQNADFHKDDVRLQEETNAENQRHDQAMEQLQQQSLQVQQNIEQMREANQIQQQQMSEGAAIYEQQGQQAFTDWQNQQNNRMQILSSALNNPWLQQLAGMTPAPGQAGAAVGGQYISQLVNQILQPFNVQQWGTQNAPAIANLQTPQQSVQPMQLGQVGGAVAPSSLTWDQLSEQLKAASPGNYNDAAAKNLAFKLSGQSGGNSPLNLSSDQINQIVAVATNNTITSYGGLSGQQAQGAANTGGPMGMGSGYFVGTDHRVHQGDPNGTGQPDTGMAADPSWPVGSVVGNPQLLTQSMGQAQQQKQQQGGQQGYWTKDASGNWQFTPQQPGQAQMSEQNMTGGDTGTQTMQQAPGTTTQPNIPQQNQVAGTPQVTDPSWSQWQGWNPFQMAAYRTNMSAQGPGAWEATQNQLQQEFTQQGGSPDVTAMQAAAADPTQAAGQQMTANVFGQTVPQWQQNQQRQWSRAQAPNVKQNMSGIAA